MKRVQLQFESLQQIVGDDNLAALLLVDNERQRALSIVVDEQMTQQLLMRLQSPDRCRTYLPEVLVSLVSDNDYQMMIYGVHDGQYQVVLSDSEFEHSVRLRISDAVLLNIIAHYPLFIEGELMERQSIPFDENATGVAIPINTMDSRRLNMAMKKAIAEENYELASQLRDELKKRSKK